MTSWDERYSGPGYLYGTEPNAFLVQVADRIPRGPVLCLCDGEGRNGVWLAGRKHAVVSVDNSRVGLAKARRLAAERKVPITTVNADLAGFSIPESYFAAVVAIFCHLPPELRARVHRNAIRGLKPGGAFILEAYTPRQLDHGTGGPHTPELLMEPEDIRAELDGLEIELLEEIEREIQEGERHVGKGAVLRVLGFRPEALRR